MRILSMKHSTAISPSPAFTSFYLLVDKAVFYAKKVIAIRRVVSKVTILFVEFIIAVITYFQQTILYTKCICVVFTDFMQPDFGRPVKIGRASCRQSATLP